MITGKGSLLLSEEAQKMLQERLDIGVNANMHTVAVLWQSPIAGELSCRSGYFVEMVEAEIYANYLEEFYKKMGVPRIIFINGKLHAGGWKGNPEDIMKITGGNSDENNKRCLGRN